MQLNGVNQEKAQKEIVEQTKRVEEANDEASFDNSIKQVEQVDPELTAPEESTAFFFEEVEKSDVCRRRKYKINYFPNM